jgi:hypothetical protein
MAQLLADFMCKNGFLIVNGQYIQNLTPGRTALP